MAFTVLLVSALMIFSLISASGNKANCEHGYLARISSKGITFYGKAAETIVGLLMSGKCSVPTKPVKKKDCTDKRIRKSGVYTIYPVSNNRSIKVYCDMETDGGGWIVIQRRINGKTDFYRGWRSYETGFGDLNKEFWLGNRNLHAISTSSKYELRVDLEAFDKEKRYAKYNSFQVGDAKSKYQLNIGKYTGNAGDSMSYENHMAFSTKDQDNDKASKSCAVTRKGGWWYNACYYANLNGDYNGKPSRYDAVCWYTFKKYSALKTVSMKMRRVSKT